MDRTYAVRRLRDEYFVIDVIRFDQPNDLIGGFKTLEEAQDWIAHSKHRLVHALEEK